ncbi:MAG: S41 family peptidase [Ginsengibacter sp.]
MRTRILGCLLCLNGLISCSITRNYNPNKEFSKHELQQDYTLLRNILEKKHPSLYWYTPKDSMDHYFDQGYQSIADSMTELQFGWKVLAPLTNKIHCGHTSFSMSKGWNHFIRNKRIPSFPLYLKIWGDTMVVTANLSKKDSVIKKGMLITAVNGTRNKELIHTMLGYLVEDGYENNVNYIRLSSSFPYFHRNIFGIYKTYSVNYIDSMGREKKTLIPLYSIAADTLSTIKNFPPVKKEKGLTRKEKLENIRSFHRDSSQALITLNSFAKGHLKSFFRKSFNSVRKHKVSNVIIDIRANGGGDISNYVALTRYLKNAPFKVADTAFAIGKSFRPYTKYISSGFINNIVLFFIARKKPDGLFHFGYWENHTAKPKRRNHFDGGIYVLTNGLTFSASALFCNSVKGQQNVKLVGETTGGGWYGNSGIMIPDIVLPHTKLRVRLPVFRLVQYHHVAEKGTGVLPDIYIGPTLEATRNNADRKMDFVNDLIRQKNGSIK